LKKLRISFYILALWIGTFAKVRPFQNGQAGARCTLFLNNKTLCMANFSLSTFTYAHAMAPGSKNQTAFYFFAAPLHAERACS